MSFLATLAAAATLAVSPAPQAALTAQETADLQCLAMSMVIGGMSEDESVKTGLMAASMFYLGRLEGRNPNVVWLDRLGQYLQSAQTAELEAQSQRCGTEIAEFGGRIQTWSTRMAAQSAPAAPATGN
ncbi:MAG: hypothetical protein ACT6TH_08220 [Brevundimonas sp.]|jgi:hypothetical protein|uniref:hypothetical protein n=1 Tax=Brevundimonas sp. TaxID=1871086 RepID=UPI004033DEC3